MSPKAGESLTPDDFDMILEAIGDRQKNFPNEPPVISMGLVFFNIGDRFAPVSCVAGEWSGLKQDIPKSDDPNDLPKCPGGHVLTQGRGLKLGWLEGD
jgi:hypothetical protein